MKLKIASSSRCHRTPRNDGNVLIFYVSHFWDATLGPFPGLKHTFEILCFIQKENLDMVVMASRGRKGKFSIGSVAENVVKNSDVPVVTVPVREGA